MPLLGEPPLLLAPIQEVELSNDPRFSGWRFMSLGRGFARHCAENMSVLKACVVYLIGLSNSTSSWSLLNNYLFDKCNIIVLLVHFLFPFYIVHCWPLLRRATLDKRAFHIRMLTLGI